MLLAVVTARVTECHSCGSGAWHLLPLCHWAPRNWRTSNGTWLTSNNTRRKELHNWGPNQYLSSSYIYIILEWRCWFLFYGRNEPDERSVFHLTRAIKSLFESRFSPDAPPHRSKQTAFSFMCLCEIWSHDGADHEDNYALAHDPLKSDTNLPKFRSIILIPSSGSKNKPSRQPTLKMEVPRH
jgi:hypothetical protein